MIANPSVRISSKPVGIIEIGPPIGKGDNTMIECTLSGENSFSKALGYEMVITNQKGDFIDLSSSKQFCSIVKTMLIPVPYKKKTWLGDFDRIIMPKKGMELGSGKDKKDIVFSPGGKSSILRCMIVKEKYVIPNLKKPNKEKSFKSRVLNCAFINFLE